MRIVSGDFKGRQIMAPEGLGTRPTSDRARQAVFNILAHASWCPRPLPDECHVIDIFAGTGALGLEALSRGAADAVFVDMAAAARRVCQQNIDAFGLKARATVLGFDAVKPPPRPAHVAPRDLVFLDPPYGKGLGAAALENAAAANWLAAGAVCVMEMSKKEPERNPAGFTLADTRHYGVAQVCFYLRDLA
jgi:16S rRNA (guanine966-N2)-methyltransferase